MNDHPNVGLSLYPSEEWLTFQNRVKTMLERLGSHGRLLVKPTTHWDYLRAFRRLIYLPPGAWGREPAKNSRSYNRAAFRYGAFARLSDHLAILDGIDPRFAPGSGTLVRGGATYREAHLTLEMIAAQGGMRSFEIVEVNPLLDQSNITVELACELILSALGKTIL